MIPAASATRTAPVERNPSFNAECVASAVDVKHAIRERLLLGAMVAAIAICYLAFLSPGHVFVNDDFAAYLMHAKNLVEGHLYTDIRYIPNPDAMWLSPTSGYPPVYPIILAPVYRLFGLNLRAFKFVTALCFVVFLALFSEFARSELGPFPTAVVLFVLAFNPIFWDQRNIILSEFPYVMFSFAALLAINKTDEALDPHRVRVGSVLLTSALLYCAYGTRTIGIALVFALIAADLARFRRPRRFLIAVLALTAFFIVSQSLLMTSPGSYIRIFHFSFHTLALNAIYYSKTLSYVWQNGYSKQVQIVFALLFTALATLNFGRSLWKERGAKEFYLLGYVAVLTAWNAQIGLRGLLPVLPLYFLYGFQEVGRIFLNARPAVRIGAIAAMAAVASLSYAGQFRQEATVAAEPDVTDTGAQEMFAFVRAHTSPNATLAFPKPRTLALFTARTVGALSPNQTPAQCIKFMTDIHSNILIDPDWSRTPLGNALESSGAKALFRNNGYRIYKVY